jgi:hypothetical protein
MFICSLLIDTVSNSDYRPGALVYIGRTVEGKGLTLSEALSSQMSGGTDIHGTPQLRTLVSGPTNRRI